jgi:lipoprotein-releasing system ATP-binding protein
MHCGTSKVKIELRNIHKSFDDAGRQLTIVDRLDYVFPEAGSVAIVGRSGVGKSTLLHLIGALDTPNRGEVYYGETNVTALPDRARTLFRGAHVGFVFQFHHLLPEFSALENVSMPLLIQGVPEPEAQRRAAEALARVGLTDRANHRPGELSGGEQQRVAIARAVVVEPRVLLADEPTGNLDPQTAKSVQDTLLEVNRELKNVLIVVTHSRELAESLDRVTEMLPGGGLKDLRGAR